MKKIILALLFFLICTANSQAAIVLHESWEWTNDIPTGPVNNSFFGGNNNCNTGDCSKKCTGGCCNTLPKIDNYAVMTLAEGESWSLDEHTFTVPDAIDGSRVFRAYAPDDSTKSKYR